jgi:hypothetical protein
MIFRIFTAMKNLLSYDTVLWSVGGFQLFGGVCCPEDGGNSIFRIVSLGTIACVSNHKKKSV